MLESRITALEATAVPTAVEPMSSALSSPTTAVMPSSAFNSAAVEVTFVPPISKVVICTSPATVTIPSATVIKSVSSPCPIVAPLITTLSTVNAVSVPSDVIFV